MWVPGAALSVGRAWRGGQDGVSPGLLGGAPGSFPGSEITAFAHPMGVS